MARLRPPPEPEDAFKGRRIAGALLKRRLAVLPTRTVYLARHEKLGRDVRVELFTAAFGEANYDYVRRLFADAARTQELHSLHVVTLLDLGRLSDCYYITTEYLPDDLRSVLDKKGRLPLRQALRIAEEVLTGLQAVAEAGAVHGNVTPDGILLGFDGVARLDHLGTALRGEDLARLAPTAGGMAAGPALYIAPERAADLSAGGLGAADIRADLYSLGCTLYQMLAGRPPYLGATAAELLRLHAGARPPDLHSERPELPEEVCRFVARLMARDPDGRPAGPAEALNEMRALADALARAGVIPTPRASMSGGKRRLFDVTWTSAWTVVAALLVAATVAPFAIMAHLRHARIQAEQATAAARPGAIAILIMRQDQQAADPLTEDDALAVRTMLLYRLSFCPKLAPADPYLVAPLERAGKAPEEVRRALGVDQLLIAAHAAGFGRRNWTLAFVSAAQKPWTLAQAAAVEQATPDMTALEEAARRLLREAAARIGADVPNPADDAVVGASAAAWAELGHALQAEADGRWAEAARNARAAGASRAAGAPFAALAGFYEAVQSIQETGRLPAAPAPPAGPLPPELAGLDGILRAIAGGDRQEVDAQFGAFLARQPGSARGYFLLGVWRLHAAGQPPEAALAFRHASELDPSYLPAARECLPLLARQAPQGVADFLKAYAQRQPDKAKVEALQRFADGLAQQEPVSTR